MSDKPRTATKINQNMKEFYESKEWKDFVEAKRELMVKILADALEQIYWNEK